MAKQSSRQRLEQQVKVARWVFFLAIPFTILNLLMILGNFGGFFLYSVSIPHYLTLICSVWDRSELGRLGLRTWASAAVSLGLMVLYLVCWLKSREKRSWMKAGLGLAVLDLVIFLQASLFLFGHPQLDILNLAFHLLAVVEMFQGVRSFRKLEELDETPI